MNRESFRGGDFQPIEEFNPDDLNPDSARRYRRFFAARRPEHALLVEDDEAFLIAIGALGRVKGSTALRPTWAGLWMLGQETSIRELFPHWHLSYKELPEDPRGAPRWLDRVYPDGVWNANLFEFYLRVIGKLHDGLKVPFQLEQGQFRVDETPVHHVVREAFMNTLVHADFQGTTGLRIIKRRSGFEFINPGLLLVTPAQLWRGGVSEPRNPALQRLFGFLRLGEREGSGGPTMRRVWKEQGWRPPRIWEHSETHLRLTLEGLLPDKSLAILRARFGQAFTGQDALGQLILVAAEVEGSVSHARVCVLSEARKDDISAKLGELVGQGMLESSGRARGGSYTISARLPAGAGSDGSRYRGASFIKDAPALGLSEIAARVSASRRSPPALVRAAILALCTERFVSIDELAVALGRKASTLSSRYVSKMLAEGLLEVRYPGTAAHSEQAYRARSTA